MQELTSSNFEEFVNNNDLPTLIDFYAEWCGPCKMLAPVLEELAQELTGKLNIVKVNVDDSNDLASKYSVTSIPTLIVLKDGEEVERMSGFQSKENLLSKLNSLI